MKERIKKNSVVLIFITAVFVLSWYYYKIIIPGADDYGSLIIPYAEDMYGYTIHTGIDRFKAVPFTVEILYKMFGMTEMTYAVWFATWFFACCSCTLYIAVKNFSLKKVCIIPIFMYIFIPYIHSNRYHFMSAAATLFYLAIMQNRENKRKILTRGFCFFTIMYLAVTFRLVDDNVLLLIFLIAPILLYLFFYFSSEMCKGKIKILFLVGSGIIVAGLRVFDEIVEKMTGTGFFGTFSGYGGSEYTSWSTPEIIFTNGIPSFVHSMLTAWNIPIEGGFIQLGSLSWCIRVVLLVFAWIGVARRTKKIFQGKIKELSVVEAMATFSVLITSLVNIVNGTVTWDSFLSVRYASVVWFLLGAFAIWEIEQEIARLKEISIKEYRISTCGIAFAGILLFVSYTIPFYLPRSSFVNNEYEEQVQYVKEEELHYGLGSFWYSTPITALSGGISDVMWINMEDDGYIAKGINVSPQFTEMKNYCNFFVEDVDTPFGVTEERIVQNWGDYKEKKEFLKADEKAHSRIYIYDYDIRWKPVIEQEDMDFSKQKEYHINVFLPLGKSRIVFEGENLQGMALSTNIACEVEIIDNSDTKMVYELKLDQASDIELDIKVNNENAIVTETSYYVVNAYKDICTVENGELGDSISFNLPQGEYFVYIEGEDIKQAEYSMVSEQGENIVVETQKGKIQQRMKVNVTQNEIVRITGDSMDKISRITYTEPYTSIVENLIVVDGVK